MSAKGLQRSPVVDTRVYVYRYVRHDGVGCQAGCRRCNRDWCVLVPVSEYELVQFDDREGEEYQRTLLALQDVEIVPFLAFEEHYTGAHHDIFLKAKHNPHEDDDDMNVDDMNGIQIQIWVYVQNDPLYPGPSYPIVQTYVDTILRGCLEISDHFAMTFLELVQGWHSATETSAAAASNADDEDDAVARIVIHYVNDRHGPVYARGDPAWSLQHADRLDRMIQTHQPLYFEHRKDYVFPTAIVARSTIAESNNNNN